MRKRVIDDENHPWVGYEEGVLSYLILSESDLIIKIADLFGYVRVGVECTDLDPEAT